MGYYTDAVNNLTSAGNALGSAVIGSAGTIAHLKNQEKANEQNFVNTQNAISEEKNRIVNEKYVAEELEKENVNEKQLLDTRSKYEIQTAEDAIKSGKLNDVKAAKIAIGQMMDKQSANREARLRIVQRLNDLDIRDSSADTSRQNLNKINPKLAKKYGWNGGNK